MMYAVFFVVVMAKNSHSRCALSRCSLQKTPAYVHYSLQPLWLSRSRAAENFRCSQPHTRESAYWVQVCEKFDTAPSPVRSPALRLGPCPSLYLCHALCVRFPKVQPKNDTQKVPLHILCLPQSLLSESFPVVP